ncbi:iron-containing alcohol dehydrogenase family protein [Bacillus sp. H-16]|uniref:iron-containing alcohol dehydrogenase family protein n=1 Tax=Alteribacter salitolerans TaxID=2912333 RepID=UPI001964D153|nr:iron-containing alcohol dehydrogenase family protein [Alteribacter salitolerans]MBM7094458.1 iron-containing alcohol dehydrogenase family protein [Alteribacter salitolerans]
MQPTNIAIPSLLEIGYELAFDLDRLLKPFAFTKAVMFFDDFAFSAYENRIVDSVKEIEIHPKIIKGPKSMLELTEEAFQFSAPDVIIAMGGGTIIDYGKFIASLRKIPFISMPTSPSNDGFSSSTCSLVVKGQKTTIPAHVPFGIIADLNIIKTAPVPFILAGTGDLMSNITALYDWEFESSHKKNQINPFAAMISKKAVNSFVRTPMNDLYHPVFLKELISSLTMGGISTVISGNTAPISGSEHLISHAMDRLFKKPAMHGLQTGLGAYIMAHVQDHRGERMRKVFSRTGFFDYVKTLAIPKSTVEEAVRLSPDIKPERYTYLHDRTYHQKALAFVNEDKVLNEILV